MTDKGSSRRSFLKLAATSTAAATLVPSAFAAGRPHVLETEPLRPVSPNDKIRIGTIGMGIISYHDTAAALANPGIEFVAAADLYDGRLAHVKEVYGDDIFTTKDYREILARPDIDAVIISVPDHWHTPIAVAALEAGKHVYLEKPMVHKVEEGQSIIDAQKRTGKVLQVGSQFGSSVVFGKAKELFESGAIGNLNMIEAVYNRHSSLGAWQYTIPLDASTETIDWDTFLGSAPNRPFDAKRFFQWRGYWDYGTGVAGDLYVHLFTGIHRAISSKGPNEIYSTGGVRYWKDGRDAPDLMMGLFAYPETPQHPEFTLSLQTNFEDGSGGGESFRFIGDEGAMTIEGGGITLSRQPMREPSEREVIEGYNSVYTFTKEMQEKLREQYRKTHAAVVPPELDQTVEYTVPRGYDARVDHFAVFFAGVREGKPILEDATFGLRAAAPPLLANESYREKKPIRWDPEHMRVVA
ncbi:MAG TPA: Gfo/Idh/MocA family oxidoreductase [Rhodothermales bacterium]|nr:Gfo/Idh/MocA family oxidoreductase [Rhodothermales bacterium]